MLWPDTMDVRVRVDLTVPVSKKHLLEMKSAAVALTNDRLSVQVQVDSDSDRSMVAEFTMVRIRHGDAAEQILDRFADFMPDYSDQTVSFPTREKKRPRKRQRRRRNRP